MRARLFALVFLASVPARAGDHCQAPIYFFGPWGLDLGDGKLRVEKPPDVDDDEHYFITLRESPSQAWATFLPDEWEVPRLRAWDTLPIGTHVVTIVRQHGPRHFFVCVDSPAWTGMHGARRNVMFPLFSDVPVGNESLSADLVGERVRFSRGRPGSKKWLLVREVGVGDELELKGVRVRLVRILSDLGFGWIELGRAR
jgi:hypothetical protein